MHIIQCIHYNAFNAYNKIHSIHCLKIAIAARRNLAIFSNDTEVHVNFSEIDDFLSYRVNKYCT